MDYPTDSTRQHPAARVAVVFILIAGVTALHYSTMGSHVAFHTLYRELYFIPIVLMSFWYGLRRGLYTTALIIALYVPHVVMTWQAQPGVNLGNLFQILVFLVVAASTGYLSDREKERNQSLIEARNLATLGRATLALTSEFRDILKTLNGLESSSLICEDPKFHQPLQGAVKKIALLNEVLSQFAPGHEGTRRDFVEVGGAIERAREKVGDLARERHIAIQTDVDAEAGLLRVNQEDLVYILEELIKNGLEHSDHGTSLTVRSRRFEDRVEIAVKDAGLGIAPENLTKIFVPFYTTKEKGTGLGLCVCRKMMRDNEGDLLVESKPGAGSTFTLIFPVPATYAR